MEHGQRITISNAIARRLIDAHKDDILYICLTGSTAKGTDRPESDIDIIVVTRSTSSIQAYHLKDVILLIITKSLAQFNNEIYNVDDNWPYNVGQLMYAQSLYDPGNFAADMKARIGKLDPRLFLGPAHHHLDASEQTLVKLTHAAQERDIAAVRYWVPMFLEHTNLLIALLNHRWFTYTGARNTLNINEFNDVPRDYPDLSRALLVINDVEGISKIGADIFNSCRKFAERHGIKTTRYKDEKDIEV